jgi:hypothetical protein
MSLDREGAVVLYKRAELSFPQLVEREINPLDYKGRKQG